MIFNPSKNYQFPPEMGFERGNNLEYVRNAKILGVIVTDNLKWSENIKYITNKAMSRIWTLRRMKNLGLENDVIFDVYIKEIRSILEFGIPVWNGALTDEDSNKIERVQKIVFKILLNKNYIDYDDACKYFKVEKLKSRRELICLKFAKKEYNKSSSLFQKFTPNKITRQSKNVLVNEIYCHTDRFFRSSVPYLARLLNQNTKSK